MRILLSEFVTGGGWPDDGPPPDCLATEGRAMVSALAADFAAIEDCQVEVLSDSRWPKLELPSCILRRVAGPDEEQRALARSARQVDYTVVIAPEFDGHLVRRCRLVEQSGGRLLGPGSALVALCGDKQATAEHLARHRVRVPRGVMLEAGRELPDSVAEWLVLKPRDGAGSLGVRRVKLHSGERVSQPTRCEEFRPGLAASVAVLCGPRGHVPLAPCRQHLGGESGCEYLGGSLPMEPALAERARRLALVAIETLDRPLGYLGVDLILGSDPAGEQDVVIEINPRLTTSYVGLRALAATNLARAMLCVVAGEAPELCWQAGPIQFESSGEILAPSVAGGS